MLYCSFTHPALPQTSWLKASPEKQAPKKNTVTDNQVSPFEVSPALQQCAIQAVLLGVLNG